MMTDIKTIVSSSLPSGLAWFDLYESSGDGLSLSFKNNRPHSSKRGESSGTGIRVNIKGRTGFSYTNNPDRISDALRMAVESAPYGDMERLDLPGRCEKLFEPRDESIMKIDILSQKDMMEDVISRILKEYPEASVDGGISASSGRVRIVNSSGLDIFYESSYYGASVSATLIGGTGVRLDVHDSISRLSPGSFSHLADNLLRMIEDSVKPASAGSGSLPVIFTPSAFARLLSLVMSGLNGRSVYKGISPFGDKMGEKVFSQNLSLLNCPASDDSPFSFPFDDEGVQSKNFHIIENGEISAFAVDLKHAGLLGLEPLPCGSRGFASLPSPSFGPVKVTPGDTALSSIQRGISKGIMVDQFIGFGQSNTLTGDFSANLNLAWLIENGEIKGRVKDCMITDNIFNLLKGEFDLSSELQERGSMTLPWAFFPAVNFVG